jgi:hypothetical protein
LKGLHFMSATVYSEDSVLPGEGSRAPWSRLHRVVFRFVFCFVSLYTVDLISSIVQRQHRLLNGEYPKAFPEQFTAPLWHHLVPWVGMHILRLAHPVAMHGQVGQDSVYEYILRGTEIVLAVMVAALWTLLARSRRDYRNLDGWLRIFVRAALAAEMLFYGLAKVPPAQFGVLSLYRQAQPLGQLWPMAMLWAFMAASPGYTLLCGLVETTGGLLLVSRRTVGLGSLISAGAMANVLALNVFYDVNQKIRCLYYFLLALYLAAPQVVRLWRLLVLQRVTKPAAEPRIRGPRAVRIGAALFPLLFAVMVVVHFVPSDLYRYNLNRHADTLRGKNYGVWRVNSFRVADADKPLLTEGLLNEMHIKPGQDRWHQLIWDAGGNVYLLLGNGDYDQVDARDDPQTGDTVLTDSGDSAWQSRLHFQRTSPTSLAAEGVVNGNHVSIALSQENLGRSHLTDGPRWISDGRRW